MSKTKIEWSDSVWNPTTGCTKFSKGCKFCYAEALTPKLKGCHPTKYRNGFNLTVHPDELKKPYKWMKPRMVFVNSMSDLFHIDVPDSFIQEVFKVMKENPQHIFQVLTKRAERLAQMDTDGLLEWSDNIWMGVSVEDHENTKRIGYLRNTGAKIKFLSCEPLLSSLPNLNLQSIDWCIVGGESGRGKIRKIEKDWVLDIQEQCKSAGVPFFFKQWGHKKFNPNPNDSTKVKRNENYAKGGCVLDGVVYHEMPINYQNFKTTK
jgi:protein gp37